MSTWQRRMSLVGLMLFVGLALSHQIVGATRDDGDTSRCPSTEEFAYLNDAGPLSNSFAAGMSRFSDNPYDPAVIRTELRDLEKIHAKYAELDPPATLEAVHELSMFGYATMIDAMRDASSGNIIEATVRLDIGSDMADRATELLDTHC